MENTKYILISHHDVCEEVIAKHTKDTPFAPENGKALKYRIGDKVTYTNDSGCTFHLTVLFRQLPDGLKFRRVIPALFKKSRFRQRTCSKLWNVYRAIR